MKTNKSIIKIATAVIGISMTASSCQDWLTVYPQTQVVEENFWEDKNDLEGVRYGAYKQMCNTVDKLAYWGELRSDNFQLWPRATMTKQGFKDNSQSYQQMRLGQLEKDSANKYFDWEGIYTTINYCNKVLQHGEEVLNKDPQFTSAEWRQMKAEMIGLRALNYFYLIRAFKDVPYTTKVINNDSEARAFEATNQLVVLDSLIADVESVKGQARNRFTSTSDTKGNITNAALYAMLSDMYLWRASLHEGRDILTDQVQVWQQGGALVEHSVEGDYQLAADYADRAMEKLAEQLNRTGGSGNSSMFYRYEMISYGLPYVNLIKNNFQNFSDGVLRNPVAHGSIFYDGNSDESIFELQFNMSDNRGNGVVTDMFGSAADHYFSASETSLLAAFGGNQNYFDRDARMWYCAQTTLSHEQFDLSQPCTFKWKSMLPTFSPTAEKNPKGKDVILMENGDDNDGYRNWIVYRLSDVMLQKAEALVCLYNLTSDNSKLDEAMKLVHALHRRWYCNDNATNALNVQPDESVSNVTSRSWGPTDDAATPNASTFGNLPQPTGVRAGVSVYEVAVMNERQLEFFGEGKRWFDLVRFAERHAGGQNGTKDPREYTEELPIGNGMKGVELMLDQFMASEYQKEVDILKTRFGNRYGLYNLIYYMEIKASEGKLEQNPAWNKSIYDL